MPIRGVQGPKCPKFGRMRNYTLLYIIRSYDILDPIETSYVPLDKMLLFGMNVFTCMLSMSLF